MNIENLLVSEMTSSLTTVCFIIAHLTFDSQASHFGQEETASII